LEEKEEVEMEEMEEEAEDESILEIFPVHACVARNGI